MAKKEDFSLSKPVHAWLLSPPLTSLKEENDCKKHCRNRQNFNASEKKNLKDKPKSPFSTTCYDRDTRTASSGHVPPIPVLSGCICNKVVQQPLPLPVEPIPPLLQTVKRLYGRVVHYRTNRLANSSTRYDKNFPSYISKREKKAK